MKKIPLIASVLSMLTQGVVFAGFSEGGPKSGDIYKEYVVTMGTTNWRVTDPDMDLVKYPQGAEFLPNAVIDLTIDDLQGATRAEIVIDFWEGHEATTGKKFRLNEMPWIDIPELVGTKYMQQVNHLIPLPLADLVEGSNQLEGTSDKNDWDWGQWGWYGAVVRVYYDSSKPHATGQITFPLQDASFDENPVVSATASESADRVDFIAYYYGYDKDGDGVYLGWQRDYHRASWSDPIEIRNHVGTDTTAPFSATWNTSWVPDQAIDVIKLVARIRDTNGYWYVSPAITGLNLDRPDSSVRIHKPSGVPQKHWVRINQTKFSTVSIPSLDSASEAVMQVATWNGDDKSNEFFSKVNSLEMPKFGADHFYSYDEIDVPLSALQSGSNTITFFSSTVHHGIEIMWPGPAISVRYGSAAPPPEPPPPEPDPELEGDIISNGGFESGMESWSFYSNGSGSAVASDPGYDGSSAALVTIDSVGTNVQLMQTGLQLEPDTNYQLTFAAYSNTGHDLRITLAKHVSPYTNYGLNKAKPNLTTSWQTFTLNFTTENFSSTVADGRLYFWFADDAQSGDQFLLDQVRLAKVVSVDPPPPDPPPPDPPPPDPPAAPSNLIVR